MCQVDKELIWETQALGLPAFSFTKSVRKMYINRRQKLILVVDDDTSVKEVTRDILERYGHNVLTADSRGAALAYCEEGSGDLAIVLLDETVLEPDPVDVLQQILVMSPAVKVIVTSIYNSGWDPSRALDCGAAGFLKKPYRMTDLLRMVEQVQQIQ